MKLKFSKFCNYYCIDYSQLHYKFKVHSHRKLDVSPCCFSNWKEGEKTKAGYPTPFQDFCKEHRFWTQGIFIFNNYEPLVWSTRVLSKGAYVMAVLKLYQGYFFNYISMESSIAQCFFWSINTLFFTKTTLKSSILNSKHLSSHKEHFFRWWTVLHKHYKFVETLKENLENV